MLENIATRFFFVPRLRNLVLSVRWALSPSDQANSRLPPVYVSFSLPS